jgi:signal peptidase I
MPLIELCCYLGLFAGVIYQIYCRKHPTNHVNETPLTLCLMASLALTIIYTDVETTLTALMLLCVACWLIHRAISLRKTLNPQGFIPQLAHLAKLVVIVWAVRSFVMQPYVVPSGSLEPTILPGDLILVNQAKYGIRLPVVGTVIWNTYRPERGEIALFKYPKDPKITYIKRVIGLPGDTITYNHKTLTINGQKIKTTPGILSIEDGTLHTLKTEFLPGSPHAIFQNPDEPAQPKTTWHIPPGHYFMMGDNRDNSNDSRYWGTVSEQQLVGQAKWIWLSINMQALKHGQFSQIIRWNRLGKNIEK